MIKRQIFKPDVLFVKSYTLNGINFTDVKYIEIKYLDDVPYNSGGQQSVKNVVTQNGSATVINTSNANLFDEISQQGIPNTSWPKFTTNTKLGELV